MPFTPPQSRRYIGPEGDPASTIAIVGEAGGAYEERMGRPFVGPAGGILESCLHSAGLTRGKMYLTNLLKFRPPKNDIKPWFDGKMLTKMGIEAQRELLKELEGIKANVIIPLGGAVTYALTGKLGIMRWRGSIVEGVNRRKMLPTIHPSAAQYGPDAYVYRYWISHDFKKARDQSDSPLIELPNRILEVEPSYSRVLEFLHSLHGVPLFAFDIEVVNHEVSCISFCADPLHSMSIPMYHKGWTEEEEINIWMAIADLLADEKVEKVGQNILFDTYFLAYKNNIITRGRLQDTMIAQHIMYPDFPKGLDFITSIYTNEPYYKDEGKNWRNVGGDDLGFRRYNAKDSAVTLESWFKLYREMVEQGYIDAYNQTVALLRPLSYMMIRGMNTNQAALVETRKEISKVIASTQVALTEACGRELNPQSPKDCQNYFYVEKGIQPYLHRKTGKVTVDDKAMQRLARGTASRKPMKEAKLVQELRGLRKLQGTYLDIEFDEDQRFRCSYNPRGTTTGRLSSSKTVFGTGTNGQNLPPPFRQFLVADGGFILVEADKRHAEWVATAFLCGDANMMKVVEEGRDPHAATASLMCSVPEDIIMQDDKLVGHLTDPVEIEKLRVSLPGLKEASFIPRSMSMRQCGKKSNHGLNYDEGVNRFSLENEIPEAEAKESVEGYHAIYPGVRKWHKAIQDQLSRSRTLENPLGRKRRFLGRWENELFKAAYAFLPQSTVVNIVNDAIICIYNDQREWMQPVELLMQNHDSVLFQYPLDQIENLKKAMTTISGYLDVELAYGGRTFTIGTDFLIGHSWGSMEKLHSPDDLQEVIEGLGDVR